MTLPKGITEDCFEMDKNYEFKFEFKQAPWITLLNENGFEVDEYLALKTIILCMYVVPFLLNFYQQLLLRVRMGVKAKVL